jgi:hypothetical protein
MSFNLFDRLSGSAAGGANYLLSSIRDNGQFVYEIDALNGATRSDYNILRHAGALYALYQWTSLTGNHDNMTRMEPAMAYLVRQIKPLDEQHAPNLLCVVEDGEAKLGGAALTILALLERFKVSPRSEDVALMRGLGAFILWMQESNGKFRSKYRVQKDRFSNFESVYYSGETLLALARLYVIDPDPVWLHAIRMGTLYLLKNPVGHQKLSRGHNHWFVLALSEIYTIIPQPILYAEFSLIVEDTIQSTRSIMNGAAGVNGTYSSVSLATRGESLVAAIGLELSLNNSQKLAALLALTKEVLVYCLQFQVDLSLSDDPFGVHGGIRKSRSDDGIRIDYVQHVLQVQTGLLKLQPVLHQIKNLWQH